MTSPYSSVKFHKASDIDDAFKAFETAERQDPVNKILAPVIRKHEAEKTFSPSLIHRRFDIEANENLVEFNTIPPRGLSMMTSIRPALAVTGLSSYYMAPRFQR
jgi:hypothetical protein